MRDVFKDILGELLDQGQITQARRLSHLFRVSTTDLDIVLVRSYFYFYLIIFGSDVLYTRYFSNNNYAAYVNSRKVLIENSAM